MEKKQYIIKKSIISSLKPEIKIPNNIKSYLPVATFIFISTWVVCGLYQGFSPTIALKQFNISNHIISAIIFSSLMAPQVLGSILIKYIPTKNAQKWGMIGFTLIFILTTYCLYNEYLIEFLILSIISAIFIGLGFTSSMDIILSNVNPKYRSGVLSTIYIICYGGACIPSFIISLFATNLSLINIVLIYLTITIISCILTLLKIKIDK